MKRKFLNNWPLLLFLFLTAVLFHWFGHTVDNPDSISYMLVAKHYINGEFYDAINGHWSPLISWLLIIPYSLHLDYVVSFKILQIFIGIFGIILWQRIIEQLRIEKIYRSILILGGVLLTLNFALRFLTPDLLFVVISLWIISELLKKEKAKHYSFKLGILGTLLFFAKSFGAVWFVAIALITRNFKALPVFILLSLIWIIPISIKYHHITISEAARFNLSKEVSPLPGVGSPGTELEFAL